MEDCYVKKNSFNSDVHGIVEVMGDSFKELILGLKPNIALGLCHVNNG